MKRRLIVGALCGACVAAGGVLSALAGNPVEIAVTLPGGGTGTNISSTAFASAVEKDTSSKLRLLAVEHVVSGSLGVTAGTISIKRSAAGVAYKSVTVATNALSAVSFETNTWYWRPGDTVYVSLDSTNAAALKLLCEEN